MVQMSTEKPCMSCVVVSSTTNMDYAILSLYFLFMFNVPEFVKVRLKFCKWELLENYDDFAQIYHACIF